MQQIQSTSHIGTSQVDANKPTTGKYHIFNQKCCPDWAPPLSFGLESLMLRSLHLGRMREMAKSIDYGNLMHNAMRGLIRQVLENVRKEGLPGDHHFFITFDTMHPDVELADWLSDRYPEEMTVVIQHWFDNLEVNEDSFSITLNFGDSPEPLFIPYDAIRTFVDPSVEFGLRFETQEADDDIEEDDDIEISSSDVSEFATTPISTSDEKSASEDKPKEAEIVSLDQFRK